MWSSTCFVLVSLLVRVNSAYERNENGFKNETVATEDVSDRTSNSTTEELKMKNVQVTDKINDDLWKIVSSVLSYAGERLKSENEEWLALRDSLSEGRGLKLKYKKAELQFFMKAFMAMKIVFGIILPLGIIAAKVLSWKAVTLSLMAFMLAKILLVKNLLTSKNIFSGSSANFVPPVFIQGAPNELFWKRQGDINSAHSWTSS